LLKSVLLPTLGLPTIAIMGFDILTSFFAGLCPAPAKPFWKKGWIEKLPIKGRG